jgi:hypothetical protein
MTDSPQVAFESALALGDVWALDQLWKEFGFDALAGVFRKARYTAHSLKLSSWVTSPWSATGTP